MSPLAPGVPLWVGWLCSYRPPKSSLRVLILERQPINASPLPGGQSLNQTASRVPRIEVLVGHGLWEAERVPAAAKETCSEAAH